MGDQFIVTQTARDSIFRATVSKENKARRDFLKNYGFLLGSPTMIIKNKIPDLIDKSRPKVEDILPQKLKVEESAGGLKVLPSPTTYPKTSSGLIGWRCYSQYWLDKYG